MTGHCRTMKKKSKADCGGDNRNHLHDLSDDLLIQFILTKLPLSCLFRCTAVCKAWRRLVHEARILHGGTIMTRYAFALDTISYNHNNVRRITRVFTPIIDSDCEKDIEAPIDLRYPVSPAWWNCDATNGFLLYRSEVIFSSKLFLHIFNPLTFKLVQLPAIPLFPEQLCYHFSMLVFDPAISHHYKVVTFFGRVSKGSDGKNAMYEEVCFLSSEQANLRWSSFKGGLSSMQNEVLHSTVCLDGYAYRLGFRRVTESSHDFDSLVLKFNVKEESFELFDSPPGLEVPGKLWSALDKAEGCLQCIYNDDKNVRIWRLEEDGRSWALRHRICLSGDLRYHPKGACVLSVFADDQVLLFVGIDMILYEYNVTQQKIAYFRGKDGKPISGGPNSLRPFLCCAIDPPVPKVVA